ncbi:glycosyltransferase [Sphingobacterium sp. E70]|uniref:glycosyltransferase n=1 Tax=Sphingobacterium sp. E70 TaxID=2853439 RepID=UPI00359C4CBB
MAKILTIIVSYNFEPWIHKCLHSLLLSSHPTDILVIDNNSRDHTTCIIKETYPAVRLIESPENLGFGKANNIGLTIALEEDYDYAFLVNQDAWVDQNCIANLIKVNTANIGIISPSTTMVRRKNSTMGSQFIRSIRSLKIPTEPAHSSMLLFVDTKSCHQKSRRFFSNFLPLWRR